MALTVLGLESSCDDTAAAVLCVERRTARILSSIVVGQSETHARYGGVVPELAARAHAERLDGCTTRALAEANVTMDSIGLVAVTAGPGLIGGILSGVMFAKGLVAATGLPLVGVNHLAGHALTARLTHGIDFPYSALLVSGGHCQFLIVHGPGKFTRLGTTLDDAPGEAFDKTARILGLPQPGGPSVEVAARAGDPSRFSFPRPLLDRPGCDMSFSGLKTAVLRARDRLVTNQGGLTGSDRNDLCAGFEVAVAEILAEKTGRALDIHIRDAPCNPVFAVAGGVAANKLVRKQLEAVCSGKGARFVAPPTELCTDNAAMIAYAGAERFLTGARDGMDLPARPRWPLDGNVLTASRGGKGPKA